jgi:hypothetical protein
MGKVLRVKIGPRTYDIPAEFIARKRAEYYTMRDLERESKRPGVTILEGQDHPLLGKKCVICDEEFEAPCETTMIPGYPEDEAEKEKMLAGEPYVSVAKAAHHICNLKTEFKSEYNKSIEEEIDLAMEKDTGLISEWAANNMRWCDVRDVAQLIEIEEPDIERLWTNADMKVIEKEEA